MSNKTEPNKEGLPQSPERGTGGPTLEGEARAKGQAATPKPADSLSANPDAPKGKAWYRVKGPGGVVLNGVVLQAGTEMQMLRTEALSVDEHVEEIDGPTVK